MIILQLGSEYTLELVLDATSDHYEWRSHVVYPCTEYGWRQDETRRLYFNDGHEVDGSMCLCLCLSGWLAVCVSVCLVAGKTLTFCLWLIHTANTDNTRLVCNQYSVISKGVFSARPTSNRASWQYESLRESIKHKNDKLNTVKM